MEPFHFCATVMSGDFSKYVTLIAMVKFRYSEKATRFEKIFHLKFDVTQQRQILSGRFFRILWPSQNIQTLKEKMYSNKLEDFQALEA